MTPIPAMAPTTRSRSTTGQAPPTAPSHKNAPRAVKKEPQVLGVSSRQNTPSAKDDVKTKEKKEKDMCAICLDVMQGKVLYFSIFIPLVSFSGTLPRLFRLFSSSTLFFSGLTPSFAETGGSHLALCSQLPPQVLH